jgi:hypothetical protein
VASGDVYITGRIKAIIIRVGHNIYPQELEQEVAAVPGSARAGSPFSVPLAARREPNNSWCSPRRRKPIRQREQPCQGRITEVATDVLGTPPEKIVLAPPRTVPKTSSGKLRRSAAKALHEEGRIGGRPGVLRVTRAMMRSDQWFPRRTAICMAIGEPIVLTGTDFAAVLRLRDAARAVILAGCGEPDLRELVKPSPAATSAG